MAQSRAAVKKPSKHTSLDRPFATMIGELPKKAVVYRTRTQWQQVVDSLLAHPGHWFEMSRTYSNVAAALSSARKVMEEEQPAEVAELLEAASSPNKDGRVTVYLRVRPHPGLVDEQPDEEEQEWGDDDDTPSLADHLATATPEEVDRVVAEPLPFQGD